MHLQLKQGQLMTLTSYGTKVDVRDIAPRDRHPLVFSTFRSLGIGETLELLNDHDPKPLFFQFQSELPGRFSWDDLQAGPDIWRVRIRKLANPHSDGQCCGSCGG
jgi:uncharacterized protein (DUF2249 family)